MTLRFGLRVGLICRRPKKKMLTTSLKLGMYRDHQGSGNTGRLKTTLTSLASMWGSTGVHRDYPGVHKGMAKKMEYGYSRLWVSNGESERKRKGERK